MLETEALVYHRGVEQEYRVRPQSESLVLAITPPLTEALGWRLSQESVLRVSGDQLNRLVAVCQNVTRAALTSDLHPPDPDWELAQRDRILVALRAVLSPWTANQAQPSGHAANGARGFQMVKRIAGHGMPAKRVSSRKVTPEMILVQLVTSGTTESGKDAAAGNMSLIISTFLNVTSCATARK